LMREPVKLPNSGTICDFRNIKHHLLNDEHDPYTRAPLKISEVIELPELKARIERWIEQKKAGVEITDEDLRKQA
jgi:ubiquitin conjugation factor E4 B